MPIDTSWASQVRPVQQPDLMDVVGKIMQFKALAQQQRLAPLQEESARLDLEAQKLKNQQAQQAIQDDRDVRDFYASTPEATPNQLLSRFGPKALPFIKSQYDAEESRIKMGAERAKQFGAIAGSITDESTFRRGLEMAQARGLLSPEDAAKYAQMPWGPETAALVKQAQQQAMSAEQQHSAMLADLDESRKAALHPSALQRARFEALASQQKATGKEPIQPAQQAQIDIAKGNAERAAMPNTPTELAVWITDPRRTAEEKARGQAAMKELERHQRAGATVSIYANQDPQSYVESLKRGEITPTAVPQAIRDRVLGMARQQGVNILSDSEREKVGQSKKIEPIVSAISELSEKINTQQGLLAKMSGGAQKVMAQANLADDVAEYESLISGFTPLIARAVGHSGVLTEQDVQSVKAMFPRPGDSKSLRDRKMARLKQILGGVQKSTEESVMAPVTTGGGQPKATHRYNPATGKIEPI